MPAQIRGILTFDEISTLLQPLGAVEAVVQFEGGMFAGVACATIAGRRSVAVKSAPPSVTTAVLSHEHDVIRTELEVRWLAYDIHAHVPALLEDGERLGVDLRATEVLDAILRQGPNLASVRGQVGHRENGLDTMTDMHPEHRRAIRGLVVWGGLALVAVLAFVLYAAGVREWWVLAIILSLLAVFGTTEAVRDYRKAKRPMRSGKQTGERRRRMDTASITFASQNSQRTSSR